MITLLSFLFTAALILTPADWISDLLAPHNLAEISAVILGMIALSASLQIRSLFEKAQNILHLYAQYLDPKSEDGSKLSARERERLLDLLINELRTLIDQFGGRILIRVGGFFKKILRIS